MSNTYFSDMEIRTLKNIKLGNTTLGQCIDELIETRQEKGGEICSSHDLFPVYVRYFGITKHDYTKRIIKSAKKE